MGTNEIIIRSAQTQDLEQAAKAFLQQIGPGRLIAFHAPMGAGKTTFITAICRALGIEETVCSPTFTLVNEYMLPNGESVYHFDFYRLKNAAEALDMGIYDYWDSGFLCLMEWPENVEELLPEETVVVRIEVQPDGSRRVSF